MYVCVCMHACMYMRMYVCVYVCVSFSLFVCTCVVGVGLAQALACLCATWARKRNLIVILGSYGCWARQPSLRTELTVQADYFNSKRTAWEPLLEPWRLALEVGCPCMHAPVCVGKMSESVLGHGRSLVYLRVSLSHAACACVHRAGMRD
jgi:hypothetical protein